MQITGLTAKNKNLIINIVVILIALLIAKNIYTKQADQAQKLRLQQEEELKKNTLLANLSHLDRKVDSYKKLLIKKDAGIVIDTLKDLAKASGVKIVSIRPNIEQRMENYVKLPFNLNIAAPDYHALGNFVSAIESYKDVYRVEDVQIRTEYQEKGLNITLTVSNIATE